MAGLQIVFQLLYILQIHYRFFRLTTDCHGLLNCELLSVNLLVRQLVVDPVDPMDTLLPPAVRYIVAYGSVRI